MSVAQLLNWSLVILAIGCIDQQATAESVEPDADNSGSTAKPDSGAGSDGSATDAIPAAVDGTVVADATLSRDAWPIIDSPCPDDPDRGMVGVHFLNGECYLVDAWPVSRGAYSDAIDVAPLVSSSPYCGGVAAGLIRYTSSSCGSNFDTPEDEPFPWPPTGDEREVPITCVSWCDAHAYCERVGKRLCTNHRLDAMDPADYDQQIAEDFNEGELFNACTGGGSVMPPMEALTELPPGTCPEVDYGPACEASWSSVGPFQGVHRLGDFWELAGQATPLLLGAIYRRCGQFSTEEYQRESNRFVSDSSNFGSYDWVDRRTMFRCCADSEASIGPPSPGTD